MTTLAVPRSLRTSATSACHALVDAKMDHRVTCLKIQGYLNLAKVPPSVRLLSPSNRSDLRDVRRREKAVMQSVSVRIIGDT
jgi:hypothetical protein